MNWLENIENTKARADKKINITKHIHQMQVLGTLRYREEACGLATEAVLKMRTDSQ
jgi:hypothetical protein